MEAQGKLTDSSRREVVKRYIALIGDQLMRIPSSRERSLTLTKLDEADMWLERIPSSELDAPAERA